MEESTTKEPVLDVVQMKQRRDQLTSMVGQRTFNTKVIEAENIRDCQEILDLCNKINAAEAQFKPSLAPNPDQEIVDAIKSGDAFQKTSQALEIETPKLV